MDELDGVILAEQARQTAKFNADAMHEVANSIKQLAERTASQKHTLTIKDDRDQGLLQMEAKLQSLADVMLKSRDEVLKSRNEIAALISSMKSSQEETRQMFIDVLKRMEKKEPSRAWNIEIDAKGVISRIVQEN